MQHPHYAGLSPAELAAPVGRRGTDTPLQPRDCGAGAQLWSWLPTVDRNLASAGANLQRKCLKAALKQKDDARLSVRADRGGVKFAGYPNPSRVDLCADSQTNADLALPGRRAWVGRARSVNAYSQEGECTGWTIGQGSVMSARLDNKTLESLKANQAWFLPLWSRAGMNSDRPVWRMEFQVLRGVLHELSIRSGRSLLDHPGEIGQYATQEWLRFTVSLAGDTNRRRGPSHPVWGTLANLRWCLDDAPLSRSFFSSRLPSLERLPRTYMGRLTSYMAAKGITDDRFGVQAFVPGSEDLQRNFADSAHKVSLDEWMVREVREKGQRFNTLSNAKENEHAEGSDIEAEDEPIRSE